jgi:hypothetical protein
MDTHDSAGPDILGRGSCMARLRHAPLAAAVLRGPMVRLPQLQFLALRMGAMSLQDK